MDRVDKLSRIKTLTIFLNRCRDAYYNNSKSPVSDSEYDNLFDELKDLENECDFYFCNSPTRTVGYVVNDKLPKVRHTIPLLSLDKTKDWEEAYNFTKGKEALLMMKLDGLTICIVYENGKLVEASTRGNGEEGSLITDNVRTFMNVPSVIEYKGRLKISGEGLIHINDFKRINDLIENEYEKYKTPRNLTSGSVQQLDSSICAKRMIYFYGFDVLEGYDELPTLKEKLDAIHCLGFDTTPYWRFDKKEEYIHFEDMVNFFSDEAKYNHIPIDGMVIKYNDIAYGKSLGKTGHHFKNGIALKFKEEEEETIIRDIEWQVGRTGKITPVAVFDPVILDGTTVERASLHNLSVMQNLGIKKNATVKVVKKNEIIPAIISSVGGDSEFELPTVCPVCGEKITVNSSDNTLTQFCNNPHCNAKSIRSLAYFVGKDGMNIDGLSEKKLQVFVDNGFVKTSLDIYKLSDYKDDIVVIDGMGEKSYEKLIAAIEKSRDVKLENFITALGIPNIALSKAKILAKEFKTWQNFETALNTDYDFTTLESFGDEIDSGIKTWFKNIFVANSYFSELVGLMRFVKEDDNNFDKKLEGMVFVITGDVHMFANRKELQEKIENLGGKCTGSVSAKTTYLINNDNKSSSSKNEKAKKIGIPIITEEEFLDIIK